MNQQRRFLLPDNVYNVIQDPTHVHYKIAVAIFLGAKILYVRPHPGEEPIVSGWLSHPNQAPALWPDWEISLEPLK